MDFFSRKKKKSAAKMTLHELRVLEIKAESKRVLLERKAIKLVARKQAIFDHGAEAASTLRQTFAQQFHAVTSEELVVAKSLSIATQQASVVSQLRTLREQDTDEALLQATDIPALTSIMEIGAARMEEQDRILSEGLEGMRVEMSEMGKEGTDVLRCWEQMDQGTMDAGEALVEADRATKERISPSAE